MEKLFVPQPRYYFDVTALCFAAMAWIDTIDNKEHREQLSEKLHHDTFRLYAHIRHQYHQAVSEGDAPELGWAAEIDNGSLQLYNEMRGWLEEEGFDLSKLQHMPPLPREPH